jgi:glucokinase
VSAARPAQDHLAAPRQGAALPGPRGRAVPVLEIGGTHVTAALVRLRPDGARVEHERREPLAADAGADEILQTLLHCAGSVPLPEPLPVSEPESVPVAAGTPAIGWGVALPGPFDYAEGIARYRDVGKFDALRGVNVGERLRAGLPGHPRVAFVNDAVAFLRGEWAHGAAAGHERAAGITLGTGVGSAFLLAGAPVQQGPQVPPQGRADLLTYEGRPLEDTVSRRALISAYLRATGERLDVRELAAAARTGDPAAREVLEHAFTALGRTLAPWLRSFGATVLVVGGSMTGSWDLIGPLLEAGLADGRGESDAAAVATAVVPAARAVPADPAGPAGPAALANPAFRVVPAQHPDQAALIGAALHALDAATATATATATDSATVPDSAAAPAPTTERVTEPGRPG